MLTLHHLEYSQSFRILWLLEELEIDYNLNLYNRNKTNSLAPTELKQLSPTGTAPVIEHDGVILSESSAIVDYILKHFPSEQLSPSVGHKYLDKHLFWFHTAQGSMLPILLIDLMFRSAHRRSPWYIKPIIAGITKQVNAGFSTPRLTAILNLAEQELGERKWFGGDQMTAADIVMGYTMESVKSRGYIHDKHPNCQAWLERIYAQPSFKRALAKSKRSSVIFTF